jgi:hypothetical protein
MNAPYRIADITAMIRVIVHQRGVHFLRVLRSFIVPDLILLKTVLTFDIVYPTDLY